MYTMKKDNKDERELKLATNFGQNPRFIITRDPPAYSLHTVHPSPVPCSKEPIATASNTFVEYQTTILKNSRRTRMEVIQELKLRIQNVLSCGPASPSEPDRTSSILGPRRFHAYPSCLSRKTYRHPLHNPVMGICDPPSRMFVLSYVGAGTPWVTEPRSALQGFLYSTPGCDDRSLS